MIIILGFRKTINSLLKLCLNFAKETIPIDFELRSFNYYKTCHTPKHFSFSQSYSKTTSSKSNFLICNPTHLHMHVTQSNVLFQTKPKHLTKLAFM